MNAFFNGFSRILDIGATRSKRPFIEDDAEAIKSDWQAVGDDLRFAMDKAAAAPNDVK